MTRRVFGGLPNVNRRQYQCPGGFLGTTCLSLGRFCCVPLWLPLWFTVHRTVLIKNTSLRVSLRNTLLRMTSRITTFWTKLETLNSVLSNILPAPVTSSNYNLSFGSWTFVNKYRQDITRDSRLNFIEWLYKRCCLVWYRETSNNSSR